ncbi:META domain-containing protein [Antarcticibacterium sp. 1MA-6-2]|uniref:META domain-containing protein n=1 Tax=Antarcticibacterium sp. 1MA-6-2 TaxID=2908210 RepID=UPI001F416BA4|nr:META domain-containing protein [Antarcticibacterium sp. 1MA-6-2]UJH92990.1 META domain-containing protein [Antarcticibacterium sp. 1MA-6-2]
MDLTFDEKRKELRGNAGCNPRFSSGFERDGRKITFSEPVSTRMFCDGKMERENQVMEILPKITEMRKNEDNVIFLSNEGEQLLMVQKNGNE